MSLQFENTEELLRFLELNRLETVSPESQAKLKDIRVVAQGDYRRKKPFTEFELDYLRTHHMTHPARVIAKALSRSPSSVSQMLFRMRKHGEIPRKNNRNSMAVTSNI